MSNSGRSIRDMDVCALLDFLYIFFLSFLSCYFSYCKILSFFFLVVAFDCNTIEDLKKNKTKNSPVLYALRAPRTHKHYILTHFLYSDIERNLIVETFIFLK